MGTEKRIGARLSEMNDYEVFKKETFRMINRMAAHSEGLRGEFFPLTSYETTIREMVKKIRKK